MYILVRAPSRVCLLPIHLSLRVPAPASSGFYNKAGPGIVHRRRTVNGVRGWKWEWCRHWQASRRAGETHPRAKPVCPPIVVSCAGR